MSNTKLIGIVVYSTMEAFNQYINLDGYGEVKIVNKCNNSQQLRANVSLYKEAIFVIDESVLNANNSAEAMTILDKYSTKFIYCCSNLIDGFFVKKNASSEIFVKNNKDDNRKFIWTLADKIVKIYKRKSIASDEPIGYGSYNIFNNIVAIGASTGGTEMVFQLLKEIPISLNIPVVVVQHMPPVFTKMYADRMNKSCDLTVIEAKDGDMVRGRYAYIAPGGKQMEIEKRGLNYYIKILPTMSEHVNNPSVDVLFNSVAKNFRSKAIGVILTGIGKDGSKGLLNIRNMGGKTIGQDKDTCVVYGMPKVAFEIGAVMEQLPLSKISSAVIRLVKK